MNEPAAQGAEVNCPRCGKSVAVVALFRREVIDRGTPGECEVLRPVDRFFKVEPVYLSPQHARQVERFTGCPYDPEADARNRAWAMFKRWHHRLQLADEATRAAKAKVKGTLPALALRQAIPEKWVGVWVGSSPPVLKVDVSGR